MQDVKQPQNLATMLAKPLPNMGMKSAKLSKKLANKLVSMQVLSLVAKQVKRYAIMSIILTEKNLIQFMVIQLKPLKQTILSL